MDFYLGTHMVSHAYCFEKCFISINRLNKSGKKRKSNFAINDWILDSGAFTEISTYGYYRSSVADYASLINRWVWCGHLELAVSQDYMCEPVILTKTGLSVKEHQKLTIERYDKLLPLSVVDIMPVLQGFEVIDYIKHIEQYSERLHFNMRVGVGSICKRNSNPHMVAEILEEIKRERPDLRLHGFGLKTTALESAYISSLLYSADSMAWSIAARKQGKNANGLQEAIEFVEKIKKIESKKPHQFLMF